MNAGLKLRRTLALFLISILLTLSGGYWDLVKTVENRFMSAIDSIDIQRGYQGLILDHSGIASLVIGLTERDQKVFIKRLQIDRPGSQEFLRDFFPNTKSFSLAYIDSWISRVTVTRTINDFVVSATLLIPIRNFALLTLLSLTIASAIALLFFLFLVRNENESKLRVSTEVASLAKQVSHDIRSPLAALEMILKDTPSIPEDYRLMIRSAVGRIRDISNQLSEKHRLEALRPSGASPQLLMSLIDPLVTEKRMLFRSNTKVKIEADITTFAQGLFACVSPIEFHRVLSNLINNGVESITRDGVVVITLVELEGVIELAIRDTGKGIPSQVLGRLGQEGVTFGKNGGSGLGLFHARKAVESWGGCMKISSVEGTGTSVLIRLPQVDSPEWFAKGLEIEAGSVIAILDDDESVHHIWQKRFEGLNLESQGVTVRHFSTSADILRWSQNRGDSRPTMLLSDYELLGSNQTGFDVIRMLNLQGRSVLVTSHFDEESIRTESQNLSVKLLPKGMASSVPIIIHEHPSKLEAVLIDDDELIRCAWKSSAKKAGVHFRSYRGPKEFALSSDAVSKKAHIYIDAQLGNGTRGELVAKNLHERGFSELHLATSYNVDDLEEMPFLRTIQDKRPPWGIREA